MRSLPCLRPGGFSFAAFATFARNHSSEPAARAWFNAGRIRSTISLVKLVAFNIRHGGGSRIARIQDVIAGHAPDVLIVPEFRNNPAGTALRNWLTAFGHVHQAAGVTDLPAHNTVLVTARSRFTRIEFPELG